MPFQFGAAPGPAPGAAAPAGGFSFSAASSGGTSSAASSSTGSGTSFSFGSNQASSTATSSTTPGGFSFGGTQAPSNGTGSGTSAGFAASSTAQASPAPGGFTFGTTSNAPAQSSNNPATKPGPSFGSTSAPPSGSTPVPSDKTQNPTGGPAPTLGPAGGFTLGGSATSATSTAAPNATAPAPSKEGFSFGAPGTGQSSASAPTGGPSAGGFAFGASSGSSTTTAATSAPPTGGFSFGSTAPGTSVTPAAGGTPPLALGTNAPSGGGFGFGVSAVTPAPAPGDGLLEVPLFETSFPRLKAHSKVRSLVGKISNNEREGRYAGEDLVNQLRIGDNTLGALLSNPQTLDLKQKDMGVRQRLAANPTVKLYNKPAGLTAQMAQEVFEIADDLRVSEIEALSLYAEASKSDTRKWLEVTCDASFLDKAMAKEPSTQRLILGNDVRKGAKELYFLERLSLMKTILFLLQNRLNAEPVGYLMVATDELIKHDLVGNLIKLIRQSTVLMVDLEAELKELPTTLSTFTVSASAGSKKFPFAAVLIEYLRQERKIAAECLFYLTYHTQCTPVEVATMVDLLKDLTNGTSEKDSGLPVLDPFKDVPDAYQKQPLQWQGPFTTAPPLKDKDALDWQRELIQTTWTKNGKAQLLECVGIVVVAILSAIGTKNVLVDRTSHLPNDFGEGNALFPMRDASPPDELMPVHERLNAHNDAGKTWKRQDIWGVLAAAYAVMLRPIRSVVSSPRLSTQSPTSPRLALGKTGRPSTQTRFDVKRTWKACLSAPSEKKSFTFMLRTLIPSFRRHHSSSEGIANTHEFLMSVMSEFVSSLLDLLCAGNEMPLSRLKWEQAENEDLRIRREDQEQEAQFRASYGGAFTSSEPVPAVVDLLKRPDCVDDVFAVAAALCSEDPLMACHFWSIDIENLVDVETNTTVTTRKLVPSRALMQLKGMQESDSSLIPTYLSFLAGLAMAVADGFASNGATVVSELLQEKNDNALTWRTIISTLRWYVRTLNPLYSESQKESTPSLMGDSPAGSTAYYYNVEGIGIDGSSGYDSSFVETVGTKREASTGLKELAEDNAAILLSHLAVISKVAKYDPKSRVAFLSTKLPVTGADESSGQDDLLLVLFSLSMAPLAPELRGDVFATISTLLVMHNTDDEQGRLIREMAQRAWDLLEQSQIFPVSLFDQYPIPTNEQNEQRMLFPPSSTLLAGSGGKNAILKADQKHGILYEFEHVESAKGYCPSTEGFLLLLSTLITTGGCDPNLGSVSGQRRRVRTGVTPYIEFVLDFVLPRAVGSCPSTTKIPFRTTWDSSRLVSRALEVVHAAIIRYKVPLSSGSGKLKFDEKQSVEIASGVLRLPSLAGAVLKTAGCSSVEEQWYNMDFDEKATGPGIQSLGMNSSGLNTATDIRLPVVKSPGFTILADMMSGVNGILLKIIATILSDQGGSLGVRPFSSEHEYRLLSCLALFGDTPPSVMSARTRPPLDRQSLLMPLMPQVAAIFESRTMDSAVYWREQEVRLSLQILCAAVARENEFRKILGGNTKVVPVVSFSASRSLKRIGNYQLSRLGDIIMSSPDPSLRCLPAVIQYIGYIASDPITDLEISSAALGFVLYGCSALPHQEVLRSLCALGSLGQRTFAYIMAQRLQVAASNPEDPRATEVVEIILDCLMEPWLAEVLVGFSNHTTEAPWSSRIYDAGVGPVDCLESVLELTKDYSFISNPTTARLASRCYQILCRLATPNDSPESRAIAQKLSLRLEARSFWMESTLVFLADRSDGGASLLRGVVSESADERGKGSEDIVDCVAWGLRGAAQHIANQFAFPEHRAFSRHNQGLVAALVGANYQCLRHAINAVPLASDEESIPFPHALFPFKELALSCTEQLRGPPECVQGYYVVNVGKLQKKVHKYSSDSSLALQVEQLLDWANRSKKLVRWDCACNNLANSVVILIEQCLKYLDWLDQCGFASLGPTNGLLGERLQIAETLLGITLKRLVEENAPTNAPVPMDGRLMASTSTKFSLAGMMLVERLAQQSSQIGGSTMLQFLPLLAMATQSSSMVRKSSHKSTPPTVERTLVLGTALVSLLKVTDGDSVPPSAEPAIVNTLNAFAGFSCTKLEASVGDQNLSTYMTTVTARSILSSLISLDRGGLFVQGLSHIPSPDSMSPLRALVNLIQLHDVTICTLLEKLTKCLNGGSMLLEAGVLKCLLEASSIYTKAEGSKKQKNHTTIGATDPPSFLFGHLMLLNSLLACEDLSSSQLQEVADTATRIVRNVFPHIQGAMRMFPTNGDLLLELVECLSLSSAIRPFHVENDEDGSLVGFVVAVLTHLVEFPFPDRFAPILPDQLREGAPTETWWTQIEALVAPNNDDQLPNPPTGPTFSVGVVESQGPNWTIAHYEACLAGAKVVGASLFAVLRAFDSMNSQQISLNIRALSSGLCRLSDSMRAIADRVKQIDEFERENRNQSNSFMSREKVSLERSYIVQLRTEFLPSCEKTLVLIRKHFSKQVAKEGSAAASLRVAARYVFVALERSRLDLLEAPDSRTGGHGGDAIQKLSKALKEEMIDILKKNK